MPVVIVTSSKAPVGGLVFVDPEITITFEDDQTVTIPYIDKEKLLNSLDKLQNMDIAVGLSLIIQSRRCVVISLDEKRGGKTITHTLNLDREDALNKIRRG